MGTDGILSSARRWVGVGRRGWGLWHREPVHWILEDELELTDLLGLVFLCVLIRVEVVELLQVFVYLSLLEGQLVVELPAIAFVALVGLVVEEPLLEQLEALLPRTHLLS